MSDELRRARAAVRKTIERVAGRRTATTGGVGPVAMSLGLGDLDVIALETGGELTELGGTTVNGRAVESSGEIIG